MKNVLQTAMLFALMSSVPMELCRIPGDARLERVIYNVKGYLFTKTWNRSVFSILWRTWRCPHGNHP